jgi:hypothetical protein
VVGKNGKNHPIVKELSVYFLLEPYPVFTEKFYTVSTMTPPVMPYIHLPQKERNNPTQQPKQLNEQQKSHEVGQDGYASRPVGVASAYAVRAGEVSRTRQLDTQHTRSKKRSDRRQTVHLAVWVTKPISLEVDRITRELHLTRSKAGRYLIELGIANNILSDQIKVIVETIRETTAKETRKGMKQLVNNSYRSAFYSAQNRTLLTNILHLFVKLVQEDPETTQQIFQQSEEEARDLLTFLSPQLADLIKKHEYGTGEAEREG